MKSSTFGYSFFDTCALGTSPDEWGITKQPCIDGVISCPFITNKCYFVNEFLFLGNLGSWWPLKRRFFYDILCRIRLFCYQVESFVSYCGGLPAPEHSENPLRYKFRWVFPVVFSQMSPNYMYVLFYWLPAALKLKLLLRVQKSLPQVVFFLA